MGLMISIVGHSPPGKSWNLIFSSNGKILHSGRLVDNYIYAYYYLPPFSWGLGADVPFAAHPLGAPDSTSRYKQCTLWKPSLCTCWTYWVFSWDIELLLQTRHVHLAMALSLS
jgi:hypothetical protein